MRERATNNRTTIFDRPPSATCIQHTYTYISAIVPSTAPSALTCASPAWPAQPSGVIGLTGLITPPGIVPTPWLGLRAGSEWSYPRWELGEAGPRRGHPGQGQNGSSPVRSTVVAEHRFCSQACNIDPRTLPTSQWRPTMVMTKPLRKPLSLELRLVRKANQPQLQTTDRRL